MEPSLQVLNDEVPEKSKSCHCLWRGTWHQAQRCQGHHSVMGSGNPLMAVAGWLLEG